MKSRGFRRISIAGAKPETSIQCGERARRHKGFCAGAACAQFYYVSGLRSGYFL
jgi:hypothetical protein